MKNSGVLNWEKAPDVLNDCFNKGTRYFFKMIGSNCKSPTATMKEKKSFFKFMQLHLDNGNIPWYKGTVNDMWNDILKKTAHGGIIGKKASVDYMFSIKEKNCTKTR